MTIENFTNSGNIKSLGVAGGCIGRTTDTPEEGNTNNTVVIIKGTKNICESILSENEIAGGIVGFAAPGGKIVISNSYNNSEVITNKREAGGIIGDTDEETYCINVYNSGVINAKALNSYEVYGTSAGIIGSSWSENSLKIDIINSYNIGEIFSEGYSCGVFGLRKGEVNNSSIENVYAIGNLNSTKDKKYGIVSKFSQLNDLNFNINNVFYMNADKGSKFETDIGQKIEESEIKSEEFVNKLNKYVEENPVFDVGEIAKINLLKWKLGGKEYPELDGIV